MDPRRDMKWNESRVLRKEAAIRRQSPYKGGCGGHRKSTTELKVIN